MALAIDLIILGGDFNTRVYHLNDSHDAADAGALRGERLRMAPVVWGSTADCPAHHVQGGAVWGRTADYPARHVQGGARAGRGAGVCFHCMARCEVQSEGRDSK